VLQRFGSKAGALLAALGLALVTSGCPLSFEKDPRVDVAPTTFFDSSPADTSFTNEVSFRWIGTDEDSDVVAYQFQLFQVDSLSFETKGAEGERIRSIRPRFESPAERWSERQTDQFFTQRDLEDGWYEFRVRAIDAEGVADPEPAVKYFYVFFDDIAPTPFLENQPLCGRLQNSQSYVFLINATDASRSNPVTARSTLEYSVQLRSLSQPPVCTQHTQDPFTDYVRFPDDGSAPIPIGNNPPTVYQDLFPPGCDWRFTLRVRDPAGNTGVYEECVIRQPLVAQ
jgi:hypothetical protein